MHGNTAQRNLGLDLNIPQSVGELSQAFNLALEEADKVLESRNGYGLIVMDGVDVLQTVNALAFTWLRKKLPPRFNLVYTTSDESDAYCDLPHIHFLKLPIPNIQDGLKIVTEGRMSESFNPEHYLMTKELLSSFLADADDSSEMLLPFYLSLIGEIIQNLGSFKDLKTEIECAPPCPRRVRAGASFRARGGLCKPPGPDAWGQGAAGGGLPRAGGEGAGGRVQGAEQHRDRCRAAAFHPLPGVRDARRAGDGGPRLGTLAMCAQSRE